MDLLVNPSTNLHGEVAPSANKSHSFRALIFAALADGVSIIKNAKKSQDWQRAIRALKMLGAEISEVGEITRVKGVAGKLKVPDDVIDCGNSGQIFRFFLGLASGVAGYSVLTGDESIRKIRPAGPLLRSLNELGAWAVSTKNDGHAPLIVKGKIRGGTTTIDGADSQPVTGLLLGCALAEGSSEIKVINAGEKPWIALTLYWFDRVGIEYQNIGGQFEHYKVKGQSKTKAFEVEIPKDWSAAMYPILAGVVIPDSEITVKGVDWNDPQGDKLACEALQQMGAQIEIKDQQVVARYSKLRGAEIDCNNFVDQFMTLAMAAAVAEGKTRLYNAEICRHKECDRIKAMASELRKMGVIVEERQDGLVITGSPKLKPANLEGYKDHRMVMTLSIGAMLADGTSSITDGEYVEKSFTSYIEQMAKIGAQFKLQD
jgi:3-phosphoshikimate 1-carboxyvinyltransferase